jgi:hypothetical protein
MFTMVWLNAVPPLAYKRGMRRIPVVLALSLTAMLGACGRGNRAEIVPEIVPLPGYGMGDSYAFDDGTVRTVEAVSGDRVLWRGGHGDTLVTTRDVLLPPLAETRPSLTVRRQLTTPGLFPLIPGKQVAFVISTEWRRHRGPPVVTPEAEACNVGGRVPLTTSAGSFETIRVDCTVQRQGQPSLTQTYYYAPSIGYFVRRDDRIGAGAARSADLRSYSIGNPPLSDTAALRRSQTILRALEHDVSGSRAAWQDPAGGAAGDVEPVLTEHSPTLGWCREFREQMHVGARQYDLLGTACRDPDGGWLARIVTPFSTAAR